MKGNARHQGIREEHAGPDAAREEGLPGDEKQRAQDPYPQELLRPSRGAGVLTAS
jgi:hypothetical protein